jgi:hypothetical protein
VLVLLPACMAPERRAFPEPTPDDHSWFLLVHEREQPRLYAGALDSSLKVDFGIDDETRLDLELAYDTRSLEEIGWPSGEIALAGEGDAHDPFLGVAPTMIWLGRLEAELIEWSHQSADVGQLARLRSAEAPRPTIGCRSILTDRSEVRLPPEPEGVDGHVSAILPFDTGRVLVVLGNGRRFLLSGTDLHEVTAPVHPAYSAGHRDTMGRSWLTGKGLFLDMLSEGSTVAVKIARSTEPRVVTSLDGGRVDGRVELVAMAPYTSTAGPDLGPAVLLWSEADPIWRSYSVPLRAEECAARGPLCDTWRAVWIGRGHALIFGRSDRWFELREGEVAERTIPGCETFTTGMSGPDGPIISCQTPRGDFWVLQSAIPPIDQARDPREYLRTGLDVPTYTMLAHERGFFLAGSDGHVIYENGATGCEATQVGGLDIEHLRFDGERFVYSTFRFDDTGLAPSRDYKSLRFFTLR